MCPSGRAGDIGLAHVVGLRCDADRDVRTALVSREESLSIDSQLSSATPARRNRHGNNEDQRKVSPMKKGIAILLALSGGDPDPQRDRHGSHHKI